MNRYQSVRDVDSPRAAYSATGALFAAAFIIICVMYWHTRASAMQGVEKMDLPTPSLAFQMSMSSAFPLN
jgi:hypothetical protein